MCCFMEKMLASMLANFEMKVEKEVLEPLNKLSEVRISCRNRQIAMETIEIDFFLLFFSLPGRFTGDPQEQEAVCKAHDGLEQRQNQVSYTASAWVGDRSANAYHTHFSVCVCVCVLCVCVVRSQASTGPQAKQDGLREEVEEAWRRLGSIKVKTVSLSATVTSSVKSALTSDPSDLFCTSVSL